MDFVCNKENFTDINEKEKVELNGGGVGGFICGYTIGAAVGLVGGSVMAVTGQSEENVQAFIYSSLVTGGAVGAMFTGPV